MANPNVSDANTARQAGDTDPIVAAIGGGAAGHMIAHLFVATCAASACWPYIATGAIIAGGIALVRQTSKQNVEVKVSAQ